MERRKRKVTCLRKYPTNELFKLWLEELLEKTRMNGNAKSCYVYSKALKSLQACPIALSSAEDAKRLEFIGDGIVKIFAERLRRFRDINGEPTFDNIGIPDPNTESNDAVSTPKKEKRSRKKDADYIPGYRTGAYAILRALYDMDDRPTVSDNDQRPMLARKELQQLAQPYADESMTVGNGTSPYTAFSGVHTLVKHGLVRSVRTGTITRYSLTDAGATLAQRLKQADQQQQQGKDELVSTHDSTAKASSHGESTSSGVGNVISPDSHSPGSSSTSSNSRTPASSRYYRNANRGPVRQLTKVFCETIQRSAQTSDADAGVSTTSRKDVADDGKDKLAMVDWQESFQRSTIVKSVQRQIRNGYVYVNSDMGECHSLNEALVSVDEINGTVWYLTKTSAEHVATYADNRWKLCTEYSSNEFYYLLGDHAPEHAPGFLVQLVEQPCAMSLINDLITKPIASTSSDFARLPRRESPAKMPHGLGRSSNNSILSGKQLSISRRVVLEPNSFDIVLCVDHAELSGGVAMFGEKARNRKTVLLEGLNEAKLHFIKRKLSVGDYLFVARPKHVAATEAQDLELVLGPVIERKRMDDLAGSIKDGRFHEQKFRLHHCGVQKVIYLVEDFGKSMDTFGINEKSLKSAIVGTQVIDGFDVIRKKNTQECMSYLCGLLDYLRKTYCSKRLVSRHASVMKDGQRATIIDNEVVLQTFNEFNESSTKRRPLTVGDAFSKCLVQISGVSVERADAIRQMYPTMISLLTAYENCGSDVTKENSLLEATSAGESGRKLGLETSKRVARIFCNSEPFTR